MRAWHLLFTCTLLALACACGDDDDGSSGTRPGRDSGAGAICTAGGDCEESVDVGPPEHVQGDFEYPDTPPAGGSHNPCWTSFGVHDEPARPQNWVHNLEHGAVVYLYNCPADCDDEVASLSALVGERPFALLTPYADMKQRFAVVAWGWRLQSDELDLSAFEAFYDAHFDHGLESTSADPPSGCP